MCFLTLVSWFGTRRQNRISVCLGICLWVPSCLPVISALTLLGRSDLLCSGSSDLYSAYLASLSLRLHRSGFSSMKNWNLISASSSRGLRCGCISMLTLLPEFRPHFTAVPEPFCCCNLSVLTVLVHFSPSRCFHASGFVIGLRCFNPCSVSGFQCLLDLCVSVLTLRWHFSAHWCRCGSGPARCMCSGSYLAYNIWDAYSALGTLGKGLERGRSWFSTLDSLPSFCA